jgi:signal transduction histidine kinase
MEEAVHNALSYMMKRTPPSVHYEVENTSKSDIFGYINEPLFNWVIENLVKNAIDAMEANGVINITLGKTKEYVFIDFQDSGKGIPSSQFKKIFDPGFTTKKRGWGLGLSLAKRIIDNYHQGKIYVKESELKYGTTFRINLPLEDLSA